MERILSIEEGTQFSIHTHSYVVNLLNDAIDVSVTASTEMVDEWIEDLEFLYGPDLGRLVVGLEATRRHIMNDQVAILQLCVGNFILIFQIFRASCGISRKLREFLAQERFTFVGIDIKNDVEALFRDYGLRVGGRILEVDTLVAETERSPNGCRERVIDLISSSLGRYIEVPERITLSRGDSRELEPDQVMYASLDPYICWWIGQKFLDESREDN